MNMAKTRTMRTIITLLLVSWGVAIFSQDCARFDRFKTDMAHYAHDMLRLLLERFAFKCKHVTA